METTIGVRIGALLFALLVFSVGGLFASEEDAHAKGVALLSALVKHYAAARTYSGVTKGRAEGTFTGLEETREESTTIVFDRAPKGSRLKLASSGGPADTTVVYDGASLWSYYGPLKAYTKTSGEEAAQQVADIALGPMGGIVLELLRSRGKLEAIGADRRSIKWLRSESGATGPVDVVTFLSKSRGTATVWIDRRRHLVRETYDLMPLLREQAKSSPNAKALPEAVKRISESRLTVTIAHEGSVFDKPIEAGVFVFQPPADAKQVDEFDESAEVPEWARVRRGLVGKPAPQVTAATVEGGKWSTADLVGQASVLYFCAAWLPHCRDEARALAEMAGKRGARLILVSEDTLDEMKTAFGSLLKPGHVVAVRDHGGVVAEKYEVNGIPAAVVVDEKGIVRAQCPGPNVTDAVGKALAQMGQREKPR
jgi:peroxiredoxin